MRQHYLSFYFLFSLLLFYSRDKVLSQINTSDHSNPFSVDTVERLAANQAGSILPIRGLVVQFERRGWPSEFWSGQVIRNWNDFDPVLGRTVAAEVALQMDTLRSMGVNTITYELRTTDPAAIPGDPQFPACLHTSATGLQWPQPTPMEIANLLSFFNLVQSKDIRIFLRLVNVHMEEQNRTNSAGWLGEILRTVKDHPALDLVLFEGNTLQIDTNGDGVPDACGTPAEPPLWLGPRSAPAEYVKWAIRYALSLGIPARKLSAEAVVGDYFVESGVPAGPDATDRHLWSPIAVLKSIFDEISIPDNQRTYALSFYEHRKCSTARGLPCIDADPHTWAEQTLQQVFSVIGQGKGARVVAPEMGLLTPVDSSWRTEQAFESLILLMQKYGVDGGCFWRWTSFEADEDGNPQLADPVKKRGVEFVYNPIKSVLSHYYSAQTAVKPVKPIPSSFLLEQNYPNPFNPSTTIEFSISEPGLVELAIYNPLGMKIETLAHENLPAGRYRIHWNPGSIPNGVYFYRLHSSEFTETKKLLLLK